MILDKRKAKTKWKVSFCGFFWFVYFVFIIFLFFIIIIVFTVTFQVSKPLNEILVVGNKELNKKWKKIEKMFDELDTQRKKQLV